MRYYLILLVSLWIMALSGVPVARTILNSSVTHASASETRCITAYFESSFSEQLNRITLWDTSNPVYPRQGITLACNLTWGLYSFRQPTLKDSLLFYLDSYVLRILDITNVDIPVEISQLQVSYVKCFTLWDHYVLLGTSNGTILTFDVSNPAQPSYVSTTTLSGYIDRMWVCGDKLGVSCGSPINYSARLFAWQPYTASFTELASVISDSRVTYVGEVAGRMVHSTLSGTVLFHSYSAGTPPVLVQSLSGGYNLRQVLAEGDQLYARGEDNIIRIWQMDGSSALTLIGHYDLSHISTEPGLMFELKNDRLIYSVDTMICMILDVSDLSAVPEYVGKYVTGLPINSLAVPQGRNWLYFLCGERLDCLKLDSSGELTPGIGIPDNGYTHRVLEHRQLLYLITTVSSSLRLWIINVQDPENPVLISDTAVASAQVFTIKGDYLYLGSILSVGKYRLNSDGLPLLERTLSYYIQENGYDVYIIDLDQHNGFDYGIGIWGDIFSGYYPILVYWLPDGSSGFISPPYLLYEANVVGDFLLLGGKGINVLSLECGIPRLDNTQELNNHTKGVQSILFIEDRFMMECYEASNQIRIYDLINPRNPMLLHTIYQTHSTQAMGVIGNRLICANGIYGMEVYDLPFTLGSPEDTIPQLPVIAAWPNPFKERIELSFEQDRAAPARIECYNIKGQKVDEQVLRDAKAGENRFSWDGRDLHGNICAPGIYIIRIHSSRGVQSRKITRLP